MPTKERRRETAFPFFATMSDEPQPIKPADLRGILNYVPRFLGQTFVVALDGALVEHENLPNLLLDMAVLRSLQINVVIAHGIGKQLTDLSQARGIPITSADGSGPTDEATLDLAIRASSRVSHQILEGLTQSGLKCAITNSARAKPVGIIKGRDYERSGQIARIDGDFLRHLIAKQIVPIIQPIGFDRDGRTLRINSDAMAIEVGMALEATKVVFLAEAPGLVLGGQLRRQLSSDELEGAIDGEQGAALAGPLLSKARHALLGIRGGISRIHILDGRLHDGLLREIFSSEGVGTLVYGNEYQQIRKARRQDVPLIYHLTRSGVLKEELLGRSIDSIQKAVDDFYVYEIDGNIIACMLLSRFEDAPRTRELSSLFVHPLYQKRGIGLKLVRFAALQAAREGAGALIALSTQSFDFFKSVCGFEEGSPADLPPSRAQASAASARKSRILVKRLSDRKCP